MGTGIFSFALGNIFANTSSEEMITMKESIYPEQIDTINIRTDSADIELLVHEDPTIEIILKTNNEGTELMVNHSNETVDIRAVCPRKYTFFPVNPNTYSHLLVLVPKNLTAKWDIGSHSGDVAVKDFAADLCHIESKSGDIGIANLNSNILIAKTLSGDVDTTYLISDEISIETASGEIEMEHISGNVICKTESGDVSLKDMNGETISVQSASGEIDMKNITINKFFVKTLSGNITGNLINSKDFSAMTASGNMKYADFTGDFKGKTGSGDVQFIDIKETSINILSASGDIKVSLGQPLADYELYVKTLSGEFITNLPIVAEKASKNTIIAHYGNGKYVFNLESASGDISFFNQTAES